MKLDSTVPYVHHSMRNSDLKSIKSVVRNDLQGLRGWAVLAVVIFHFFPEYLPYGFLGVDVFFVLSGFLIALVLHDQHAFDFETYAKFYFRRLRRIFPLLLLIVLLVVSYYAFKFSEMRLYYHMRSAIYALFFSSNIKQSDIAEEYFLELAKADDFLTHTWSLAVEVQFYVIAPLLLLFGKSLLGDVDHSFLVFLFLVAVSSFSFHALSEPSTAFNNVFARLWQFTLGAFVFQLQMDVDDTQLETNHNANFSTVLAAIRSSLVTLVVAVACCPLIAILLWHNLGVLPRLLVTVAAALTIYLNTNSPLLTHKSLVMLGDCSYSLYLLHWPAVCLLKEYGIESQIVKMLTIVPCVNLSYLCFIYFEKWYLKLCKRETFLLIGGLYLANTIMLLHFDSPLSNFIREQVSQILSIESHQANGTTTFHSLPLNATLKALSKTDWLSDPDGNWTLRDYETITPVEAAAINTRFNLMWGTNLLIPNCTGNNLFGLCEAPRGKGNITFMSIGNSYNTNHARLIIKNFHSHYSSLHFHSRASCFAIPDGKLFKTPCTEEDGPLKIVREMKPDVLFVIQRFFTLNKPLCSDIDQDEQFNLLMNGTEELAKYTKKVFIMNALPQPKDNGVPFYTTGAHLFTEKNSDSADLVRTRMKEVAKRCSNCVLFDIYNSHLTPDGQFMAADPRSHIVFFEVGWHHTPYALRMVEPVFKRMAANFSMLLKSVTPYNIVE